MGTFSRGLLFDSVADVYELARPHYPPAVYDAIEQLAPPPARLLEIGPGSGQATMDFAARGYRVIAVEPGEQLASRLRIKLARHPGSRVWLGRFEDWVADEKVGLVAGATSLHWLDPESMATRIASALRPGGVLAPFWGKFHNLTEYQAAFDRLYAKHPNDDFPPNLAKARTEKWPHRDHAIAIIEASGLFTRLPETVFEETVTFATQDYVALVSTFSETLAMPANKREAFLADLRDMIDEEFDGNVTKRFVTTLTPFRLR